MQFIAKDMKDGACRVAFLGAGAKDFVPNDPEQVRRELSGTGAARMANVHTHPLGNSGYFAAGKAYDGEIMFVSEAMLAPRRVSQEVYQRQAAAVRAGRIPGFNLSSPSVSDFLAAEPTQLFAAESPDAHETVSVVLTSGGSWTYSVDPAVSREKAYDLIAYAKIFDAAFAPATPADRRARARRLFDGMEGDLRAFLGAWGEASLQLRAPYSAAAMERFEAGDDGALRAEFAAKVGQAERFSGLLATIGISAIFAPFDPAGLL